MAYLTRQQVSEIINNAPENLNKEKLLQELAKTNTIEGYNEPEKKSNFLRTMGVEIAKPFVQSAELLGLGSQALGATAKAGYQLIRGKNTEAQETIKTIGEKIQTERAKPLTVMSDEVSRVETPKQALGTALNLASNLVGGGGAAKAGGAALKSGLKSVIKTGAKVGTKSGALYGAGEALSEDRNVLLGTIGGSIAGGLTGAALPAAGSALVGTAKVLTSPFSTAINKIAPSLDKIATKIENVLIKPSKTDINHGFKAENIFKYDLGGSLGTSLKKADTLLNNLRKRAVELRGKSKAVIDIKKIMSELADDIDAGKIESRGAFKEDIQRAFSKWITEIEERFPDGTTNTVDAQILKEFIGDLGSWVKGSRDLNANSMEAVSNSLYTKVKKAIENAVDDPKELREINQKMTEIIPIKQAIIRRLPIAEKNQVLGLTDMISLSAGMVEPKAWGLFILNRLTKSGRVADIISKSSQKLKSGATKLLPLETKLKNIKPGLTIEDVSKKPLVSKTDNLIQEAKKYKSADEFIKAQGKTVYHGTAGKFDTFDDRMMGSVTGAKSAHGATWFTDDKDVAKAYSIYAAESGPINILERKANELKKIAQRSGKESDWSKYDKILEEMEKLDTYEANFKRRELANVKEAVLDGDFYKVNANGKSPQELSADGDIDSWLNLQVEKAKKLGKDGLIIENIDDAVGLYDKPSTHYAIFNTSKIKTKSQLEDIWNKAQKLKSSNLIQEAKKYKNADDFIKAQGTPVYHGTLKSFNKFDTTKISEGNLGKGIYLTDNPTAAKYHSLLADRKQLVKEVDPKTLKYRNEKLGEVIDINISKDAKIKEFSKMPTREMVAQAKQKGFDGVKYPDTLYKTAEDWNAKLLGEMKETPNTTLLFNSDKIKTKSQLQDIWNKAHGKLK